jgi:hypothetical protein
MYRIALLGYFQFGLSGQMGCRSFMRHDPPRHTKAAHSIAIIG